MDPTSPTALGPRVPKGIGRAPPTAPWRVAAPTPSVFEGMLRCTDGMTRSIGAVGVSHEAESPELVGGARSDAAPASADDAHEGIGVPSC